MTKFLLIAVISASMVGGCTTEKPVSVASKPDANDQSRVDRLINSMSLEEKVSLLGGTGFATRAIDRLGIPALEMTDGPVGIRIGNGTTGWPAAIAMASTFDPELVGKMARELGEEARSQHKRLLLGPTVNITRTPWGGRNFESYGEDPFLTSQLARAYVTGVQSMGVGTSIKHFAANNQEWGRDHIDVHVSERALREIYWPAFAAGVEAGSVSVMAAYNKVNGAHCSENSHLLQEVLKREWGFKGFVVSDWVGTHSTINSALNGLDLEMPNPVYFGPELLGAIQANKVPLSVIDDKVRRILNAMEHLNLFEQTASKNNPTVGEREIQFANHHPYTALKIAQESLVLLKNERSVLPLPIKKNISVAVLGPSATHARTGGGGSSFMHNSAAISASEGLQQRIRETGASIDLRVDGSMSLPGDAVPKSDIVTTPFHGEFFNNTNLSGQPTHRQEFSILDFDWEWNSPGQSVNAENFSVRWTAAITPRQTGEHAFRIAFTQAARVYLDDKLIFDHWSADVNQARLINETVHRALTQGRTYQIKVEYYKTKGIANLQLELVEPTHFATGGSGKPSSVEAMVRQADYVLLFVGQSAKTESESFDRTSLRLSAEQESLILKTAKANPNTVVIVQAGSPIDMTPWASKVRSILYAWYPGEQGGLAIADALLGSINPSGRLPMTFPKTWDDSPVAKTYPGANGVTTYSDDIFVGYRYFDSQPGRAAYRFGHGLSYTTFASKIVNVMALDTHVSNPDVKVRVDVKNTGARSGQYVVQLYLGELDPTVARPVQELKGIKKIFLAPGQTADVEFKLDAQSFRHFDEASDSWVVTPGKYRVNLLSEEARAVDSADIDLLGNSL